MAAPGALMRVVVTGGTGFLGRHLVPRLRRLYGETNVVGLCSRDYDLTDPAEARRMFSEQEPDVVVHLAAYSGGIGANSRYSADFFYRNLILIAHVFQEAAQHGVRKLVYTMGGCSYPASAKSPIDESQMWNGYPQVESAGYAEAKKMGLVAAESYRRQHGLKSVVLVPGNMYGEYDNFRTEETHVIPAMVRRFHEARLARRDEVLVWGTGKPVRDFVYAGDIADTIPFFIEHYEGEGPVNISSGIATSIRELAETVRELVGYEGQIVWDSSKSDGQQVKVFDVSRLKTLGLLCQTPLREGLRRTIDWFVANYEARGDRIRL